MVTTQQNAQQEVLRFSEFQAQDGARRGESLSMNDKLKVVVVLMLCELARFYKLRDADFRPNPVTHLRPWDGKLWHARQTSFSDSVRWLHHAGSIAIRGYDSLTINFTNAGSLTRAIRRGKHVEPLCKILPSCRMVPVKAGASFQA